MNQEAEHRIRRGRFSLASSGLLTALVLAVVLGIIGAVWSAHLRGRLHKLSTVQVPPDTSVVPRPGGQDLLDLHRITPGEGVSPQFTGLAVMPGLGMGILQLTLDLPGHEPAGILAGTPLNDLQPHLALTTGKPDATLQYSPFSLRLFPATGSGPDEEILGTRASTQLRSDILPGGTGATATFAAVQTPGPDGITPAALPIEATVSTTVTDRGLDVTLTARNVSSESRRLIAAWSPRFLSPSSGLEKLRIVPPDNGVSNPGDRSSNRGNSIPATGLQRAWTDLKHPYLSAGPELQIVNEADGYTLKMIALTPTIRTIRLNARPGSGGLGFLFSTAGASGEPTVVGPGESLQWHVRVQVSANTSYVSPGN